MKISDLNLYSNKDNKNMKYYVHSRYRTLKYLYKNANIYSTHHFIPKNYENTKLSLIFVLSESKINESIEN